MPAPDALPPAPPADATNDNVRVCHAQQIVTPDCTLKINSDIPIRAMRENTDGVLSQI
jgi:hypothetical protein